MNLRRWLVLVLVVLIGGTGRPALRAQAPSTGTRPSHLPVGTDLGSLDAEARLAGRLMESRDKLRLRDQRAEEQKELQELVKKLLKDPELLKSLSEKFSPRDLERWKESLDQGQGLDSKALEKLIKQARIDSFFKPDENNPLKELADKVREQETRRIRPPEGDREGAVQPEGTPPAPTGPPPPPRPSTPSQDPSPWTGLPEKPPEWLRGRMDNWVKDLEGWAGAEGNQFVRDTLRELAKHKPETSTLLPKLGERARGLGRYVPRVSLPRNILPRPPRTRLPALPRIGSLPGAPRLSGGPSFTLAGAGKAILWCAVLGLLAVVIWRAGSFWQKHRAALLASSWRLGPWPVRPQDVSTRGDLVRAFEHLALLSLGPAARTCHHLELAGRLGAQPALDADRRREAADTLARLYEQARYTPEDETLPAESMRRARRELCYLAGVVAA
jgi:hypothetical protein